KKSLSYQCVLIDAPDVLASRTPRRGIQSKHFGKWAILLKFLNDLLWDHNEPGNSSCVRSQFNYFVQRNLASPISHEYFDVIHSAKLRDILSYIVQRGLQSPTRIAHVAVVPRTEDQREHGRLFVLAIGLCQENSSK